MKYYIKTFGCQMNVSDSERIAGFLEAQKFKPTDDIKKANLVIFNTCGVRQMAEDRVYGQIHNIKNYEARSKNHAFILLTGCLANRKDVQRRLKDKVDLFFPINDFNKFENWIIENCKLKISVQKNKPSNCDYLSINPKYSSIQTSFVPIMTGCNNFCSYCVVPYARGREVSRPVEDIIKEISNLVKNGCKEITLLGQNVNSYNFEFRISNFEKNKNDKILKHLKLINSKLIQNSKFKIQNFITLNFPILLNLLSNNYPGINFKFLTSHPKDFSGKLIKIIAKNKNISREIHLPIQSGSDKILKLMNRPYTQKKYLSLIQKIERLIPDATFTTDVIVGFPGETKKDFAETVKVFKKVKYNEAYINKYSPRPGTSAWKLGDPISWEEKKRKEKFLRKTLKK